MDSYLAEAKKTRLCGIEADEWIKFFSRFAQ